MNSFSPEDLSLLPFVADDADAVWIEDLSEVKAYLDLKKDAGVKDFRLYFNENPEELIRCRRMIHIVDANRDFFEFFDIHQIDEIHANIFSFFPIEILPAYREELVVLSEGGAEFKAKIALKTGTGMKDVEIHSSSFPGYEKTDTRVIFSCTKISKQIGTANDLCDPWETINRFIRYVNVPVFAWDLDMKIILYNRSLAHLTGIPQNEALGGDISLLFPEKHYEKTYDLFMKATTGERLELTMIPIYQRSGDIRTILWNSAEVTNSKGIIVGMIAQGVDVTEQRWAKDYMNKYISELIEKNDELELAQYQLKEINQTLDEKVHTRSRDIEDLLKQKDEFITQIGHDLKTPLTPLLAILPVLRKKEQDPRRIEYLDMAIRNANHAYEILISIIKIARLNKSYLPSTGTIILIHQMVEEIIINFEYEILKKRITVDNLIPSDLQMKISPIDFDSIFNQLLDNAIKYSYRGGIITIDGELIEKAITIRIKDTGIGLVPMQKNQIFEKFYKGDPSRHDGKSFGLGLSIAQKIVERNGGTIKVESQGKDLGTTFILSFPYRMEYDI